MRTPKDILERKAISDVKKYGLHVIHVLEDENGPGFSYSIGLFENFLHPEIIIIGLKVDLAKVLLNNMAFDIRNGKTFTADEFHDGVLDNFRCYFGKVPKSKYDNYVGWGIWFYEGYSFPLVQCVYPTIEGTFPWENDFPEDARFYCEMITEPPRKKLRNHVGATR